MPHVILEGPVDLKKFYAEYQPLSLKADNEILKLQIIFISQAGDMALIEGLAIESGPPNRFFIQIISKNGRTTVKLYPWPDPEKTPGVKKLTALVARQLKAQSPEIKYGTTNLKDFLSAPCPESSAL